MDASEIYSERLNAKEVIFTKEKGEFIFPIADGRIKPLGGDQDLRTPTSIREHPIRRESHLDFLGESEGSLPPPHDSFPDASEAINDFWSMSGNFIFRHHVEPRVKQRIWKGDFLVADIEELENLDASEIRARRLNAKEPITPKNGDIFVFPIAEETVTLSGQRSGKLEIRFSAGPTRKKRRAQW